MNELLTLAVIPVVIIAIIHKSVQFHNNPANPRLFAVRIYMYIAIGVGFTLVLSPAYTFLGDITGVPNIAQLCKHIIGITSIQCVQFFLHALNDPQKSTARAKKRAAFTIPIIGIMIAAFFATPKETPEPEHFLTVYATAPGMGVYMVCYLLLFTIALIDLVQISLRYRKQARRPLVRAGATFLTTGFALAFLYVLTKANTTAVLLNLIDPVLPTNDTLSHALLVAAVVSVILGGTIPAALTLARWPRRLRILRALHPLWLDVYRATPGVVLNPPRTPSRPPTPSPASTRELLLRRIVEIRDGARETRPYLDPSVVRTAKEAARASGLSGDELAATAEAARLAASLHAARDTDAVPASVSTTEPLANLGGADLDTDAATLLPVALAYATSPIVASIIHEYAGRTTYV